MVVIEKILDDNDGHSEDVDNYLSDPIWITQDRHVLLVSDIMIESEELLDKHVSLAQHYAKKQFPLIGGLKITLI